MLKKLFLLNFIFLFIIAIFSINTSQVEAQHQISQTSLKGICGQSGIISILLLGTDEPNNGIEPFGADAIRLVILDFDKKSINVINIPRDTVIVVYGQAAENKGRQSIGLAYHYEYHATNQSVEEASALIATSIKDNFDIDVDYYITLNSESFEKMIDEIGGIKIVLEEKFITEHNVEFNAGTSVLNGKQSVEFIKSLVGGNESRVFRQNLFITSLKNQVINLTTVDKLPALIELSENAISTDLNIVQLLSIACLAENVEEIEYQTISELNNFDN